MGQAVRFISQSDSLFKKSFIEVYYLIAELYHILWDTLDFEIKPKCYFNCVHCYLHDHNASN